jgi:2-oxoglutarate ferredoxin oxidoreductase subunit alpha
MLYNYDQILIPEMNTGQLLSIIRNKFMVPAIGLNKIKGMPFSTSEILARIEELSK